MPATDGILCDFPRRSSMISNSSNEDFETRVSFSSSEENNISETSSETSEQPQVIVESGDFKTPDNELVSKIVEQLEFYFSDENLSKDAFLLKHVRRNKEGLVSLKLVSSFKKIKCLTKDWNVVLYSVGHSDKLSVNAEETKVRRNMPYSGPEIPKKPSAVNTDITGIDQSSSKTLVATNLDVNHQTIESVAELFSKFGSVTSVRIVKPNTPLPADLKTALKNRSGTCAVVEFSKVHEATKAISNLGSSSTDGWRGMKVFHLQKAAKSTDKNSSQNLNEKKNGISKKVQKPYNHERYILECGGTGEPAALNSYRRKQMALCEMKQRGLSNNKQKDNSKKSPSSSPSMQHRQNTNTSESSQSSLWFQKRLQATKDAGASENCSLNVRRTEGGNIPEGVVRLPRGPDRTSGFHAGSFQDKLVVC